MKQLQAGDKIVRQMTRDGAVELNKATGGAESISARDSPVNAGSIGNAVNPGNSKSDSYVSAKSPASSHASNTQSPGGNGDGESLYIIGGVVDRVQTERAAAKKRIHRKANMEIYNRVNKRPETSRLQFTEAERNDKTMSKAIRKSDKAADRYARAQGKIPKENLLTHKRVSDKPNGKTETRLIFRESDKPTNGKLKHALERPAQEAANVTHKQISKYEGDNIGIQAAHSTEKAAEGAARKLGAGYRHLKFRHYRAADKAGQAAVKANAKALYQRSLRQNPNLKNAGALQKAWYKRKIKREYAKAFRAGKVGAKGAATTVKTVGVSKAAAGKLAVGKAAFLKAMMVKVAMFIKLMAVKAAKVMALKVLLPVAAIFFLLILLMVGISSCMAMFGGGFSQIIATTYTAEDEDILGAHSDYTALENALADRIANIHNEFPGYDEYRFYLDPIGHDPHELISFLTALYFAFTQEEVQATMQNLFNQQYVLTLTPIVEVRTRQETHTGSWVDSEGNVHFYTYTVTVQYDWYVLVVTLVNRTISEVAAEILTPEQFEMFLILMETQGNRPDLFGGEPLTAQEILSLVNFGLELPRIFRPAEQNASGAERPTQTQGQPTQTTNNPDIPPATLPDSRFAAMMAVAERYVGYPYVWGGSNPVTGFDCSGFVFWVINQSGVGSVGRTTANGLYNFTITIPYYEARPGDLVFFQGTYNTRGASHVGIYVGGGRMIHAGNPVGFASKETVFWQRHFKAFGRLP